MAYVKVFFYMSAFCGLGYGALKFVQFNEEKLIKELESSSSEPKSDADKKRKLMMEILKNAAENKAPVKQDLDNRVDRK